LYQGDLHKLAGKKIVGESIIAGMVKRYAVVSGASPMTRIFHFTTGHVALDFAEQLAKEGIQATIIVEAAR
jgi:hypothetical protein